MSRIPTKDAQGNPNGWLLPLWNVTEHPELRPDQVYLTAIARNCKKGPHLHMRREQRYYCIRGAVQVIARREGRYDRTLLMEGDSLVVEPGVPSELVNVGTDEAWIVNMPAPAWTREDPDDWPVEGWME